MLVPEDSATCAGRAAHRPTRESPHFATSLMFESINHINPSKPLSYARLSRRSQTRTLLSGLLPLGVEVDDPPYLALGDAVLADASRSRERASLLRPLQESAAAVLVNCVHVALPPLAHVRNLIKSHGGTHKTFRIKIAPRRSDICTPVLLAASETAMG